MSVDALAAMIRGDAGADLMVPDDRLLLLAKAHGVDALLARAWLAADPDTPQAASLKQLLAGHEAIAMLREAELRRVLEGLASAGVSAVVIKGAHLGCLLYASPALRPRADTDLVVDMEECSRAAAALESLGYTPAVHVRGTVILGQRHFHRAGPGGIVHAVDLHWRIASPLVFRHLLDAAQLRSEAVPIPRLGSAAIGPSPLHALAIACVHLVAHHRDDPLLLWLYEIACLADALDEDGMRRFVAFASRHAMTIVCGSALDGARRHFDTPRLANLAARLKSATVQPEPSAQLLSAGRPVDELWLDLRWSEGWRERATLVREHLCPDAEYMRAAHGGWLPLAYVRRAVKGAVKWSANRASRREEWDARRVDSAGALPSPAPVKTSR